ncbi:TetR/AcrR family transcriptional regulator [Mycobacterium crocinum]|uniref:TetR/AcrR family transcriptional regulator n=2 Tax=Mycolicibacterium TaxID=1866885 RepID=A0ABX8VQY9_9MYCO|nr:MULTISPECIES: TetR/AcrR family transcriptional regulator [Mycolicibacterium]MCV7218269.1 TetR/AcrR family transcriptional regulator [Mycolicibacterium crocinum]QYL18503.1 TetR/AcrR family transcriptional regulator [Mycolicibacterium pallens]ULN43464.1 TetR/AcrR family transcriptional regulator [Mycolicibacterium crocinum]
MASTSKSKDKDVGTRERLMEATAQIMREEGYAGATSRRVAARAGVRSALVYYYFPTMDDLFVAVLQAGSEASLAKMRQAITADEPLRTLWAINTDPRWTGLYAEFVALANHRKVISAELKSYAERVRDIETAAATVALRSHGVDLTEFPPVAISMLVAQSARSLCNESAIGMTEGHKELRELVERFLNKVAASQQPQST